VKAIRFHFPDLTYPLECPKHVLNKSDVVHIHSQNSLFNIAFAKHAKRIGKPLVVDFLALDYLKFHPNPLIRRFGVYYQERIQCEATKLVDKAITLNERDYSILWRKYGVESEIVPHGIDERYLIKPKDDKVFREKYGVYAENIIAYVGRIHPSKGLDILIRALPLIMREVDDVIAVIAGRSSEVYMKRLVRLVKSLKVEDEVKILGYVDEDEKISLLDASKVFVFPTRHFGEAYPLVIDEAYARGVPIVATEVGALPYRVKHMETGVLIPPNDPSSLAKVVVTLLKDSDLLASMRSRLQSIRTLLLTWRQVCLRLDKIYDSVEEVSQVR
jgi:glycosyltransferase involved in cell wall biosynthesis